MTAAAIWGVRRISGRLIVNPTTAFATTDYPYGGTEVGLANGYSLDPSTSAPFYVQDEGLGATSEILESGDGVRFTCFLRGYDDDAIQRFFPGNYTKGTYSQHAVFQIPGNRGAGMASSGRAIKVAYIPDDTIMNPGLILYAGVANFEEGQTMAFRHGEEFGFPLVIDGLLNSSGHMLKIGILADLSLT